MVCVYCSSDTQVINSRHQKRKNTVWRRRKCLSCGAIFTTTEITEGTQALSVSNGRGLEPFLRDKLFISVYDSVKHRKSALADATGLTDTIVASIYALASAAAIEQGVIAEVTYSVLERFDSVAAMHYGAFHPS